MIYVITTLLNGVFSFLQVLLILGITFGLSDFLFALGVSYTDFIERVDHSRAVQARANKCKCSTFFLHFQLTG